MKTWQGEFPVDKAGDMDDAARKILLSNIRAGMSPEARIRADLKRFTETGELPDAWAPDEPEPDLSDEEFDRRVAEINAELHAIMSGAIDTDDPRHPNHPMHCARPCCSIDP